ncbi:MAG: inosine/xanthosine triphosphatase [Pyrobaculum sp.]
MLVAVASKNPNKIRAVAAAYAMFGIPAVVKPVEKPPGIPPQPVGLDKVAAGAAARAIHAQRAAGAEHGVGIEAGAVEIGGRHLDVTIAAVADRDGGVTYGVGPGFHIPTPFLREVLTGVELGDVADRLLGTKAIGYRQGLVGHLTRGKITRYHLNLAAVAMALIPRLPYNKKLY